jgi:hypothetical protein
LLNPPDQAVRAVSLEVAPDLVELLTGIAHHFAGFGHIGKFGSKFQQRQLAPCYLLDRGHVALH